MKPQELRPLISRGAIALGVCVGVYMIALAPAQRELGRVRAQIESTRAEVLEGQSIEGSAAALNAALSGTRTRSESLAERGRRARDEREAFDSITELAVRHRVTVQQLTPLKNIASRSPAATTPGAPQAPPAPSRDLAIGYTISFTSEYGDMVRMIHSLEHEMGYAMVTGVRAAPIGEAGSTLVQGEISVELYSIDPTPVVAGAPTEAAR